MPWSPEKKAAWARANPDKVKAIKARHKASGKQAETLRRNRRKYLAQAAAYRSTDAGQRAVRKSRGQPEPTRPRPIRCECCGMSDLVFKKPLCLDHCHATGAFRGWICDDCNLGIGRLGDDIEGVQRALDYLKRCG